VNPDAEATHYFVRSVPGRVFTRLVRMNAGAQVLGMHVELTPAEALEMAGYLEECARLAIAADQPVAKDRLQGD
jgi:hypothetical protein